ncbi:39S ribosomal protein L42, mitochondrial [Trichonephila clavata]|uniref:Large ribosomal subunit protein mL42 n=1 Tax=Trichonephila clavata TaxID=2740835 RepID=A0A8X6GZJ6_TRICU|nr:39S ribosomal protein L42, mitochondrial [Trichonephila clavata]
MILSRDKIWRLSYSFLKSSRNKKGKQNLQNIVPTHNHLSYSTVKDRNSWVVLSKDSQTICCWHPEEAPPYEHTKPLPEIEPELREGDSVLKLQYRRDAKYRFQPDGPTIPELAKLTYTTKHRWYPNNEKKYLDPNPPVDREGI